MKVLYNIFITLYTFSIKIAANFNEKAKLWLSGRKNVLLLLKNSGIDKESVIWIHCASLGEFEQGRPIIEKLNIEYPDHKILLTFFSPSGYEVRKNYEGADYIFYLPADTVKNAKEFVSIVRPQLVVFIKYEFWYNYINEIYNQKIPIIFASVIFRPNQLFFRWWGIWFAKQLNKISYIFVQNEDSVKLLDSININHAEVSGDTRFDRVLQVSMEEFSFPIVEEFKGNSKLIIGGSTWQPGEKILYDALKNATNTFKIVVAPHMINKEHIEEIVSRFSEYKPILYSNADRGMLTESNVLIIDSIGMLSQIYRYADIAYVGGGFGVGIHNLLEVSTFGVPVIYGPNYKRFREAIELKELGGGFTVSDTNSFQKISNRLMSDKAFYNESSLVAKNYVVKNAGATQLIVNKVKEYIVAGSLSL